MRSHRGPRVLAALFTASGVVHLVRPSVFEPIVPHALPAKRALVYLSGVAELACAWGLVRGERWAAPASTAVLLGVYPGNIQMAIDVVRDPDAPTAFKAAVLARLPLQAPMIWAAWQRGPAEVTPAAGAP